MPEIPFHHREDVKTLRDLEGDGGIIQLSLHDLNRVLLRAHVFGVFVVTTQTCAGANTQQAETLRQLTSRGVQRFADTQSPALRVGHDLGPIQRAAMLGVVVGEHARIGEAQPVFGERIVVPPHDETCGHPDDDVRIVVNHHKLAFREDVQM